MDINHDFLMAAGLRFERERGVPHAPFEKAEVDEAGLANTDPDELARTIWEWLDGVGADSEWRNCAYWALGKRYDPRDRAPLVAALRRELLRDVDAAYQVMIALDNIGEPVFAPERMGRSALDRAENRADAERYLLAQTSPSP